MSTLTAPASAREALDMVRAGLIYLAAADPTTLPTETQADCLRELERDDAILTAAQASVLAGFTAAQGYCADAGYSPRAWLMHQTGITRGAAAAHTAWAQRAAGHRLVLAAMAAGEVSESCGKAICAWTGKLPDEARETADEILLAAAAAGMGLRDLAELAGEMYQRSRPGRPDEDPARGFDDRSVRLETTFGGAGVLHGDLTPECAAIVAAVLDALSAPAGAEDTRTHAQRYHDALHEAMRWLVKCIVMSVTPRRYGCGTCDRPRRESVVPRQDQHEPAATAMLQPVREGEVDMTALLRAGHDHESLIIAEVGETFRAMPIPQSGDADPFSEYRRRLRVKPPPILLQAHPCSASPVTVSMTPGTRGPLNQSDRQPRSESV